MTNRLQKVNCHLTAVLIIAKDYVNCLPLFNFNPKRNVSVNFSKHPTQALKVIKIRSFRCETADNAYA